MGWAIGRIAGRDVGYAVPAICDHPRCDEKINRGLSYVCGAQPGGGDDGCGLFFCEKHLFYTDGPDDNGDLHASPQLCSHCAYNFELGPDRWKEFKVRFTPKRDTLDWVLWKLFHHSWGQWRAENKQAVRNMRNRVLRHIEKGDFR